MNYLVACCEVSKACNLCGQYNRNLFLATIRIYENLYNQEHFIHRDEEDEGDRAKSSKALAFLFQFYNPKEALTRRRRGRRVKNFEGKRTAILVSLLSVSESLR